MKQQDKEIRIQLKTVNKTTIKIVKEINSNSKMKMFSFSKKVFNDIKKNPDVFANIINLKVPGIYVLISDEDDKIYIGESTKENEHILSRLKEHDKDKDKNKEFWFNTIVFTNNSSAWAKYAEAELIRLANETGRVNVANQRNMNKSFLNSKDKKEAEKYLDDILFLIKTLEINCFKKLDTCKDRNIFSLKEKDEKLYAKIRVKDDKYILLEGSEAVAKANDCKYGNDRRWLKNKKLLKMRTLCKIKKEQVKRFVMQKDFYLEERNLSPAAMAKILRGNNSGKNSDWENKYKETL
jgi:hypothetical protein